MHANADVGERPDLSAPSLSILQAGKQEDCGSTTVKISESLFAGLYKVQSELHMRQA
jgi:hypothetical protein